jgi:putative thioredoxin
MVLEVSNFQADVLEASRTRPVVVDFWAPWCGPCRMLGPVLEKLASTNDGSWTLAKVNTDENPEVSRQYGIMSIPAVKLFVDGEVVDEFIGALPESSVREWLDKAVPSERKTRLSEAKAAIEGGDRERAVSIVEEVLAVEPDNTEASMLLARASVFTNPEEAMALVLNAPTPGAEQVQVREAILTLARLPLFLSHREALAPEPALDTYVEAIDALSGHNFEAALTGFIEVVRGNRGLDEDGARRACLALFTLLGEGHELTRKYRRTLQMALF